MSLARCFAVLSLTLSLVVTACASSDDNGGGGGGSGGSGSGGSGGSSGGSGGSAGKKGFYVDGRFLKDPCGNKVILRGVNEMIIWSTNTDGSSIYPEIAKTGANVVRIAWTDKGSAEALDKTISNALAAKLIPMVEDHDPTGEIGKIPAAVDYWTKSDVAAVLQKYADKLLLNIGNEAGNNSVAAEDFESTYAKAIGRLRDAGFAFPLIVDSTGWGTSIQTIYNSGEAVVASDPLKNTLLSIHLYWDDADGALTRRHLTAVVDDFKLPLIAGEFADTKVGVCKHGSYNVKELMALAQEKEIGWLAWSWGAVKNNDCPGMLDMTSDGTFAGLKDWGLEVATNDTNSIKNTSVRPPYIVNGSCN